MAILPLSSDYSSRDFESIRTRLIALIKSVFPTWTAFQTANFGTLLIELFAWSGDVLNFTQDSNAAESRITTAKQRRNLIALVKLLGYVPKLASAAQADLSISVDGTLVANCIVPAGQTFRTAVGGLPFQLLSPITLTIGTPNGVRTVENSESKTEVYAANGLPNQTLYLANVPFLSVISVNDGADYTQVENFLLSAPSDRHYTIVTDNNDRAKITFGDNVSGKAPTTNVTLDYKIGGGAAGNVDAGSITQVEGTVLDVSSNPVNLIVTNASAATSGADRETAASIKVRAPVSIRAPRTSIAREDFEIHAVGVSGIERALMLTHEQDPTSIDDNKGILYLVPSGNPPGYPSLAKLDEVRRVFVGDSQAKPLFPAPLTFLVTPAHAVFVDFIISATVYFQKGVTDTVGGIAIRKNLANFFNPIVTDQEFADALTKELGRPVEIGSQNPKIDFGYYLKTQSADPNAIYGYVAISDLLDVIRDTPGVRRVSATEAGFNILATRKIDIFDGGTWTVLVNNERKDAPLADRDFPRFEYAQFINGDTGASF